jgi:hypothetical protein
MSPMDKLDKDAEIGRQMKLLLDDLAHASNDLDRTVKLQKEIAMLHERREALDLPAISP